MQRNKVGMKNAIVTGASGFIGFALVRELIKKDVTVTALVRDRNNNKAKRLLSLSGKINVIECDMNQYNSLLLTDQVFEDAVFYHLAWNGVSGEARSFKELQLKNVEYAVDAMKLAKRLGCHKFIMAASVMEYEVEKLINEKKPLMASTNYGIAKRMAHNMCQMTADEIEIDYISAIVSNAYGPGEQSKRVVNTAIYKFLKKENITFSEGKQLCDFMYIDDVARAFYEIGISGKGNTRYYLGNEQARPLKEFLHTIKEVVAPEIELNLGGGPYIGVSLSYKEFDKELLRRDTGFIPSVDFREGVRLTAEWMMKEEIHKTQEERP